MKNNIKAINEVHYNHDMVEEQEEDVNKAITRFDGLTNYQSSNVFKDRVKSECNKINVDEAVL